MTPCDHQAGWGVSTGDATVNVCPCHLTHALVYLADAVMCYPLKTVRMCGLNRTFPDVITETER